MLKRRESELDYQNYITYQPVATESLWGQACSNDTGTINHWRPIWTRNMAANKKRFGSFAKHSIGPVWAKFRGGPAIVVGSGPSLKYSLEGLKENKHIPVVSCLHNFHYLEDNGCRVDYYVSLDAGDVTIDEVSEGGTKSEDEYWQMTKNKTLLAHVSSSPELIAKWQGEVLFFTSPIPDEALVKEMTAIEKFNLIVSTGGNVLGACTYIAKAICGANPIIFTGADFCFEGSKFHSWQSKYDGNLGRTVQLFDVFGRKVQTWQSYANFKSWFDWLCLNIPGLWINATEGGCLGSYPDGNLMQVKQMDLKEVLEMYSLCEHTKAQCENPAVDEMKIVF